MALPHDGGSGFFGPFHEETRTVTSRGEDGDVVMDGNDRPLMSTKPILYLPKKTRSDAIFLSVEEKV